MDQSGHAFCYRGGTLGNSWWGCIQMLTLFQTKKCHFSHPFSSKKLCRHYLDWNTNKNNFLIYTFLFLSFSFGTERINTVIHSRIRSSLENQTRFQTKIQWAKSIPVFRPKQRKNPTFWGSTFLYGLYEGVPYPPPPGFCYRFLVVSISSPKSDQY